MHRVAWATSFCLEMCDFKKICKNLHYCPSVNSINCCWLLLECKQAENTIRYSLSVQGGCLSVGGQCLYEAGCLGVGGQRLYEADVSVSVVSVCTRRMSQCRWSVSVRGGCLSVGGQRLYDDSNSQCLYEVDVSVSVVSVCTRRMSRCRWSASVRGGCLSVGQLTAETKLLNSWQ